MSRPQLARVAALQAVAPRRRFHELAADHVRFDDLTGELSAEHPALQAITNDTRPVAIVGPRGGGKSSLIAHVCDVLPDSHIALRVPLVAMDDLEDLSSIGVTTLTMALADSHQHPRAGRVGGTRAQGHL
jgi:ABC-type transport system involved in cytochrome bd biosynthesis fused ATPase/permease subunit